MAAKLYAIMTDELAVLDLRRNLDHVVTFERGGALYRKRVGDCCVEEVRAIAAAQGAYAAILKAELDRDFPGGLQTLAEK